MLPAKYKDDFLSGAQMHEDALTIPLKWKKPRTVFVNSMSDLFHEKVSFEFINNVYSVMRSTPQHTYIILTKRAHRLLSWYETCHTTVLQNVWVGVSVEDQAAAEQRIQCLAYIPAAVRFLSCEPLLGPVDINKIILPTTVGKIPGIAIFMLDWIICGGESGRDARPMHPDWARSLCDQCNQADIPFFFKQWGEWMPEENTGDEIPILPDSKWFAWYSDGHPEQSMVKLGKHKSGHLLDGIAYNQWPA